MFAWNFREMWGGISQWLKDDLEQLEAAVQAKWNAQHDTQGGHTDVVASSLDAGFISAGRLALSESRNTAAIETSGFDQIIRVVTPAEPSAIVSIVPDTAVDVTLWNLSTVGRVVGEIVILRAAHDHGLTHFGFVIRSNSSTTTPGNAAKFLSLGDGTGTNYELTTLQVGESLIVRLEYAPMTGTTSYSLFWRVLGKLSV